MKKIVLPMLLLFLLLAACSTDGATSKKEGKSSEKKKENPNHKPVSLFTYEFDDDDSYEFRGIDSAVDASTILFSTQEKVKRKKKRMNYTIYGDKEAMDLKEFSEASSDDLEDRNCSRTHLSPNGHYITFSCALDERWFVVFDTEKDKVIHHEKEAEDPGIDIFGITNDMEVLLENTDRDTITIYNLETKKKREFNLPELSGHEDEYYERIIATNNGEKLLMHNFQRLYVLDTITGTVEKIVDVEPYTEKFKEETEGIILDNMKVSPNGKYAFYRLSDNTSKDDIYTSYNFINIESGKIQSFTDFDYEHYGTIDNKGNMLLSNSDGLFLYHIDSGENHLIPNVSPGVYTDYLTITGDGKNVLYADRVRDSEETPAYELFQLKIGPLENYEVVEFQAKEEDTEKLLGETSKNETRLDEIALHPVKMDVRNLYTDFWNKTADIPYPSKFPEKTSRTSDHIHMDSYGQTIHLDADNTTQRKEIEYSAKDYTDEDRNNFCIDDDLELEKTKDGIDYYFYLFHNDEAELAFVKDDWCYSFEGKGFSKEEMFDIVDSMKTQGKKPNELPLDKVKFPTVLPIKNSEVSNIHVSKHADDNHVFHVEYRGEDDDEMKIKYEIVQKEPNSYKNKDSKEVELSDSTMEGFYNDNKLRLFVFDGTYYYTIEPDVKNDLIKELGGKDKIKEILIEIGNSLE